MIDKAKLNRAVQVLKAVDHPIRKQMMEYIIEEGPATMTDLMIHVRTLEQSQISQNITKLKRARVIIGVRDGKSIDYSINYERLYTINQAAKGLASGYNEFDGLRRFL